MVDRYVIWSERGECTWIRDDAGAFVQFRDYASLEQRAVLAEMTAKNIARDRDDADSRFLGMQAERDALAAQVTGFANAASMALDHLGSIGHDEKRNVVIRALQTSVDAARARKEAS
jgi:hypothetical protein